MAVLPIVTDQIVITASRAPELEQQTPASVTIFDQSRIERLSQPLLSGLIRLSPSAAVVTSGPAGSLTEIRIRGAEANHTLLFVDGIKIDDPASGDTPRYEILNADMASRIEIVRGPQSALWGSEAIGGVIAVNGLDDAGGYAGSAEAGSFGFARASGAAAYAGDRASASGAIGFQRARGINSIAGPGDKDGYRNLSGRARATWHSIGTIEVGASILALTSRSEFDGFDLFTGAHADTLDSSRNRLTAGRLWIAAGSDATPWRGRLAGTVLGSSNKNYLAGAEQNRTRGDRRNFSAQLERRLVTGAVTHRLIVAGDTEREEFRAHDTAFGGFTNQDRTRRHDSIAGEWRAEAKGVVTDLAVRHDRFTRFKDATTVRAAMIGQLGDGFAFAGAYAEGIAQPTFFDLYGFFPGNFVGNSGLKPESSRGFELSLRYRRSTVGASLTAYRQHLRDEIVNNATFTSVLNASGRSKRAGLEAVFQWIPAAGLRLSANYAYLKSTELDAVSGRQLTEPRRPKHSGSLAVDGTAGRITYGASVAYVGRHLDNRDVYPFDRVTLGSYWLADARIAYAIRPGMELFARGSNLLNQRYQDVYSYRTDPRGLFAGVRLSR